MRNSYIIFSRDVGGVTAWRKGPQYILPSTPRLKNKQTNKQTVDNKHFPATNHAHAISSPRTISAKKSGYTTLEGLANWPLFPVSGASAREALLKRPSCWTHRRSFINTRSPTSVEPERRQIAIHYPSISTVTIKIISKLNPDFYTIWNWGERALRARRRIGRSPKGLAALASQVDWEQRTDHLKYVFAIVKRKQFSSPL